MWCARKSGSGFVSRGSDSAFCPWWGLGFPRCRVSGTAILVAGIAVVGLCLLPVSAPKDLSLCCESALWGVSLR